MAAKDVILEFETAMEAFDRCIEMIEEAPEAFSKKGVPIGLAPEISLTMFSDEGECRAVLVNGKAKRIVSAADAKCIAAETYLLRDQGLEKLEAAVLLEGQPRRFAITDGTYLEITPEHDGITTKWVDGYKG